MQESEKQRKVGNDSFLRVLFWQFHNFRMLLGSDLLLFSNEKYVAVSLHLWDVTRQVTPLTWLEAWLDNVMASVPELAICYHHNGVVQGYELLKTDDIFLLKGISEDGTPAFHPYVVQQNGLSVLRFLQDNCKQDPGAYW
ncbi:erythroid differentiation-related factor, partial [Trifolium medium]|nr:erythroid differentiation-related factor [Trifolium medium]